MQLGLFVFFLSLLVKYSSCNSLTFEIEDQQCVHVITPEADCSVSYYFAVQMGDDDDYDINYDIFGPGQHSALVSREKERLGEWMFTAPKEGEYSLCFKPTVPGSKKIIDVDIKYTCPNYIGDSKFTENFLKAASENFDQDDGKINSMLNDLDWQLSILEKNLEHYKTRNNTNKKTVRSTGKRIFWFSVTVIALTGLITVGQSYLLQFVFNRSRKNKV